eukprot:GHRR01027736.1.p1 GENE.GHRR01027736.1~~GHRR01027736.1.p1  ORF type:complete len:135 (-),score=39.04 GHRR01027736.1:668-1072(-)
MLGPFDCTGHNSSSSILSCVQPLQHVSAVDMAGASGSSSSIGSSSNCKGAATAESPATDGAKLDELQQALQLPKMGYSHLQRRLSLSVCKVCVRGLHMAMVCDSVITGLSGPADLFVCTLVRTAFGQAATAFCT